MLANSPFLFFFSTWRLLSHYAEGTISLLFMLPLHRGLAKSSLVSQQGVHHSFQGPRTARVDAIHQRSICRRRLVWILFCVQAKLPSRFSSTDSSTRAVSPGDLLIKVISSMLVTTCSNTSRQWGGCGFVKLRIRWYKYISLYFLFGADRQTGKRFKECSKHEYRTCAVLF